MAFPDDELEVVVEVYLGADPTADPGSWPTATDLSARLLNPPITTSRGRSSGQLSLASGSASFWLNNDAIGDGAGANAAGVLTPMQATSPYYPGWDLGAPVRLSFSNVGASPPYVEVTGFIADVTADILPVTGGGMVSAVKVTLGGVWRRISQGAKAMSAIKRTVLASSPRAYWPLEDGFDAGVAGAGVAGAAPLEIVGTITFAQDETLPGTAAAPDMSAGALLGSTPAGGSSTAWFVELWLKADFSTGSRAVYILTSSSGLATWGIRQPASASGQFDVFIHNSSGVLNESLGFSVTGWTEDWHHVAITAEQDGANVNVFMYGDGVELSGTQIVAETLGAVTGVAINDYDAFSFADVLSAAHLAVGDGTTPTSSALAGNAYAGELVYERISRLCDEEGIPHTPPTPPYDLTCGPQPIGDIIAVLKDAETVGHGVIYETKDTWGLGYLPVALRHNIDAALTVNLATYRTTEGTSGDVLKPSRNDRRARNEWTITRPGGSSSTDRDATHQSLRGRWADSAEVNVETDADTLDEASWRVHEGTFDGLRYGSMPLDLAANTADAPADLLADWLALNLGARLDRTGHPTALHPPETVSLVLEGYAATIGRKSWTVNAVTEPYDPWIVGIYADTSEEPGPAEPKRYSPRESLVDAEFEAGTDTALDVEDQAGGDDLWSTTADFPFDIRVAPPGHTSGGVRLRVTAISAATGAVQTMTVTQAPVNGVERTIPAGWQVSLWQPSVYAQ